MSSAIAAAVPGAVAPEGAATAGAGAVAGERVHFVEPPHGLAVTEFALFAIDAGLFALRAVDDSVRLFVLHAVLLGGYAPELTDEQAGLLELEGPEDAEVLVVVNPVEGEPTVDLLAPIVVNRRTRAAAQLIIETGEWPLRAPLSGMLAV